MAKNIPIGSQIMLALQLTLSFEKIKIELTSPRTLMPLLFKVLNNIKSVYYC